MKQAEMQARCASVNIPFVGIKVEVCQQTATECGSVTVGVGRYADVDVQVCKKGNTNCVRGTGLCPNKRSFIEVPVYVGNTIVHVVVSLFGSPLVCVRVHAATC
jgi:hypothetical protein